MLMNDPRGARAVLDDCKRGGMGVAIDDFGTGYSSLSYLSTLPITTLKVDRPFVRSMSVNATSRKIVQTILHLAAELQIPVVAEGVESSAEAQALTVMGCEYGQGFLFGNPAPIEPAVHLTRTWRSPRPSPIGSGVVPLNTEMHGLAEGRRRSGG
jgi:EAL domain-containing protein (putative c-di-GMP-specific phosphodiesterase class I)